MTDPIFHGPPGVRYTEPTEEELRRGAAIVRQVPSVVLVEASPELEALFVMDVAATEYRNEIARELQDVTLPLKALLEEMRSIDFRAGPEEKAEYEEARAEVRAEVSRLIGAGGVMHILKAEKAQAQLDMLAAQGARMALQREVRIELRNARMRR